MLSVEHLSRRFGSTIALHNVNFTLAAGDVAGFVGRNGSGKTTTMRSIMGLLVPDEGEVTWCGQTITSTTRRRFGYLPEERGLYPKMTVERQLRYLGQLAGLSARAARLASDRWINDLELAERRTAKVEQLSLGNQQRVQLAAALLHEPELLVLDEPFSGLDPVGIDTMAAAIHQRSAQGVAVLFSSHQLELVERVCTRVIFIDAGHIVGDEPNGIDRGDGVRRVDITVDNAGSDWVAALHGAVVTRVDGDNLTIELAADTTIGTLLDAARSRGEITHFAMSKATLSQRFRAKVAVSDRRSDDPNRHDGHSASLSEPRA
jgi:ABC-2 type transport system ATP-binding protein